LKYKTNNKPNHITNIHAPMSNHNKPNPQFLRYIYDGRIAKIRRCIQYGYDINQPIKLHRSKHRDSHTYPLLAAAKKSKNQTVKWLIENYHVDINVQTDNMKNTILHLAVKRGNTDLIKYILTTKININQSNRSDETALYYSLVYSQTKITHLLITHGANINQPDNRGRTPLFVACLRGDIQMVQYLCSNGADINILDINKQTPIFACCMNTRGSLPSEPYISKSTYLEIFTYLLDMGVDINHLDRNNQTVMFAAYCIGDLDIVKLLVSLGANVNHLNSKGQTMLHLSTKSSCGYMVTEYVLDCGLDYTIRDNDGFTAVEFLKKFGLFSTVGEAVANCINKMELAVPTKGVHLDDKN